MGYFDSLAGIAFKKGDKEETIYFPNGIIGKGRVFEDPILKEKLFKYHKQLNNIKFVFFFRSLGTG